MSWTSVGVVGCSFKCSCVCVCSVWCVLEWSILFVVSIVGAAMFDKFTARVCSICSWHDRKQSWNHRKKTIMLISIFFQKSKKIIIIIKKKPTEILTLTLLHSGRPKLEFGRPECNRVKQADFTVQILLVLLYNAGSCLKRYLVWIH